jgi:hypothetical protein
MKWLLPSISLVLAACSGSPVATDADNSEIAAVKANQVMVENPQPVVLDSETPLLDWHVSWPAEVSAFPPLEKSIRDPAEKAQADYAQQAKDDRAEREKEGFPWPGAYQYSVDVKIAGDTPRLLSLTRDWFDFTGGAHPNHGTDAILWDREGWRVLTIGELFSGGGGAFASLVTGAYCGALDKERKKRRPGQASGGADDPFWSCPKFEDLEIIPQGAQGGQLSRILFHADPYAAGPYAEGDYDVELPVTAAMVAALKPEYRDSFVAAQPQ